MLSPGDLITLDVEKPAAGGRMLARHEGRVVFVAGAVPGERVRARVGEIKGQLAFAVTVDVEQPSPDRRPADGDPACGGNVFAHIAYERQLTLKREILRDAFSRLAHLDLSEPIDTYPSPERGYRMRARLHARNGRLGFYREGTHELCAVAGTGQLLDATVEVLERLERRLVEHAGRAAAGVELTENRDGSERAFLVELHPGPIRSATAAALAAELEGCTGLTVRQGGRQLASRGRPIVEDRIALGEGGRQVALRRRVGAFFQANRYLLEPLVSHVISAVPPGPVVDLYAGAGLFGLAAAAAGRAPVVCVEHETLSWEDLKANASLLEPGVEVRRASVEAFLATQRIPPGATIIVDPPRTGLTREALAGVVGARPVRIVYVSCDVATLARDAARLVSAGYSPASASVFDLFPNTAHVETVIAFERTE